MRSQKRILCVMLVVCLVIPLFALDAFAATAPSAAPLSTAYDGMKVLKTWEPLVGFRLKKGTGDYTDIKMHVNVYKGYSSDGSNLTTANRVMHYTWTPTFKSSESSKDLFLSYKISDCGTGSYTQELYVTYTTSSGTEKQTAKTLSRLTIITDSCGGNHSWNVDNPTVDRVGSCTELSVCAISIADEKRIRVNVVSFLFIVSVC